MDIEEELLQIVIEFSRIKSLARAVLESIQNDDNFEPCDYENLTIILFDKIVQTQKTIENAEEKILLAFRLI